MLAIFISAGAILAGDSDSSKDETINKMKSILILL